ncbi:MAG: SPOR domain-containing protein [Magnetococcus sp. DMHC-6]
MNPRYPTTKRYRRKHQRRMPWGLISMVLFIGGVWWLVRDPSEPPPPQEEESATVPKAPPSAQGPEVIMTSLNATKPKTVVQPKPMAPPKKIVEPKKVIEPKKLIIPPKEGESSPIPEPQQVVEPEKVGFFARLFGRKKVDEAEKMAEEEKKQLAQKSVEPKKKDEPKAKEGAESVATVLEVDTPETLDAELPSRNKDVDLTFYNIFAKRTVVLPQEENSGKGVAYQPPGEANNPTLPTTVSKSTPPKPVDNKWQESLMAKKTTSGVFAVNLAIFSNVKQAQSWVENLQKNGASVGIIQSTSNGNKLYQVRLGPYNSRDVAIKAQDRWRIPGSTPVVVTISPGTN